MTPAVVPNHIAMKKPTEAPKGWGLHGELVSHHFNKASPFQLKSHMPFSTCLSPTPALASADSQLKSPLVPRAVACLCPISRNQIHFVVLQAGQDCSPTAAPHGAGTQGGVPRDCELPGDRIDLVYSIYSPGPDVVLVSVTGSVKQNYWITV